MDPDLLRPASRTLYTFAAGNESFDVGQDHVFLAPGEWLQAVIPEQTMIVGNAASATANDHTSNYGASVDIWAPGTWLVIPGNAKDPDPTRLPAPQEKTGTLSAPTVAGVAALRLSRRPSSTPSDLRDHLLETAKPDIEVTVDGETREVDRPLVDACAAVLEPNANPRETCP